MAAWRAAREIESARPVDVDALLSFTGAPGAAYRASQRRELPLADSDGREHPLPTASVAWLDGERQAVRLPAALQDELVCHGRPMALVAESAKGRRVAQALVLDSGVTLAVWRCRECRAERREGWLPPTWISAVARAAEEIRREIEAGLQAARLVEQR
jgi:hypothetical protein